MIGVNVFTLLFKKRFVKWHGEKVIEINNNNKKKIKRVKYCRKKGHNTDATADRLTTIYIVIEYKSMSVRRRFEIMNKKKLNTKSLAPKIPI